jgi:uncharacterized protein
MATYKTPGVYVQEISTLPPSVAEVSTAIPAFIGCTAKVPAPDNRPAVQRISTLLEYETLFGGAPPSSFTVTITGTNPPEFGELSRNAPPVYEYLMYYSLSLYFKNGGGSCYIVSIGNYDKAPTRNQFEAGLMALEREDEPTLILLTEAVNLGADYYALCRQALEQCGKLKDRFVILDILGEGIKEFRDADLGTDNLKYGAAYYPFLQSSLNYIYDESSVSIMGTKMGTKPVTKTEAKIGTLADANSSKSDLYNTALYNQIKAALSQQRVIMPPSPAIAGVYASVDRERGVWKAPANVNLSAVIGPVTKITQEVQDGLNIDPAAGKSINAIRAFTGKGTLVWGARTLAGNDNEWRYVSVRRLFNMIEESAQKATSFAVFEPNDATTWLKVKAMIESYLYGLWQQGALAGPTPDTAYFVNVGLGKSMTPQDVLEGRMIVEIGIAAVRPAEFIVLRFTHTLQQA